jgi:DNA-binding transcriptional LysR family regulator
VQQLDAGYLRQSGLMMSWRESRSYRRAPIAPFTRSAVSGRLSDPHSGCIGEGIGDRSNGGAVLKVAALAGHGLVCLPIYLGDLLRSGRLVTVLDDYTPPPLTLRKCFSNLFKKIYGRMCW